MADGNAFIEFLMFSISCVNTFVSFLFKLPLSADGINFSLGDMLVALSLLMIVVTSLVGALTVANLSEEAHAQNSRELRAESRRERIKYHAKYRSHKKGG